ncbi:hypothetical protein BSZ28_22455 [Pseudomonas moraviensis]|nr:hypothetical protein BSZ28_22455 [Pseudomonas moraviensis]
MVALLQLQAASRDAMALIVPTLLRGNAARDAPRHWTRSVLGGIPTQSVGTIIAERVLVSFINQSTVKINLTNIFRRETLQSFG